MTLLTWCGEEGDRRKDWGGGEEENKLGFRLTCHFHKGDHYAASWKQVGWEPRAKHNATLLILFVLYRMGEMYSAGEMFTMDLAFLGGGASQGKVWVYILFGYILLKFTFIVIFIVMLPPHTHTHTTGAPETSWLQSVEEFKVLN